jgi:hypothetical protein
VTVDVKHFDLPQIGGKTRSNTGGQGRGPLRTTLDDCKMIIESASNVNPALGFMRAHAAKKPFRLEMQEGKTQRGFGHRSISMRIEQAALALPLSTDARKF